MVVPTGTMQREILYLLQSDSAKKELVIPQGDPRLEPILDRLQRLPDFDHETLLAANATFDQRHLLVWDKHRREAFFS